LKLPPAQALEAYRQALHLLIGAEGVEIHVPVENGWVNVLQGEKEDGSRALDPTVSKICSTVGMGNRVYSCVRDLDREVLAGRVALAAPIRAADGRLLGVVLIYQADPACLSRAGEVAISLGNFILGARHSEYDLPLLGADAAFQLRRPRLDASPRIADGSAARAQVSP
jgi:hypothetical protein